MNQLSLTARLISAAIAAAVTLGLYSTVIAISEPQRSVLIAKSHPADMPAAAQSMMAMAATGAAARGR